MGEPAPRVVQWDGHRPVAPKAPNDPMLVPRHARGRGVLALLCPCLRRPAARRARRMAP